VNLTSHALKKITLFVLFPIANEYITQNGVNICWLSIKK
jgi:hypothetical protein